MILRLMLDQSVVGYWDGGPKATFDFRIDGPPQHDTRGRYIKVGSFGMNQWFHCALGRTVKATLSNARRRLVARLKRMGLRGRFVYLDAVPGVFERQAFGENTCR